MEPNKTDVEKIIEYLEEKIENLKARKQAYDAPIMQSMAKDSTYLQMDYINITAQLQANEDNLLAIKKFATSSPANNTPHAGDKAQSPTSQKDKKDGTAKKD